MLRTRLAFHTLVAIAVPTVILEQPPAEAQTSADTGAHTPETTNEASDPAATSDGSGATAGHDAPPWTPGDLLTVQATLPDGSVRAFVLPDAQQDDVGAPAFAWPLPFELTRVEVGTGSARPWWLLSEAGTVYAHDRPRDGEAWERVTAYDVGQNGSLEVVRYREDPTLPSCGDWFVPVAPQVWDPVGLTFRAATVRPNRPTAVLESTPIDTPAADRLVLDSGVPAASSGALGGGAGPVAALRDGDATTAWVEEAAGPGVGQVVQASVSTLVPLVAIELDAAPGLPLPQSVVLVTHDAEWRVTLPPADSVRIALPASTFTPCVRMAVETLPADADTVALGELRVVTALDGDDASARDALVAAASTAGDETAARRVATLLEAFEPAMRHATLEALLAAAQSGETGALGVLAQMRPEPGELPLLASSPLDNAALDAVTLRLVNTPDWSALVEQTQTNGRPSSEAVVQLATQHNGGLLAVLPLLGTASETTREAWLDAASAGVIPLDNLIRAATDADVETQRLLLRAAIASTPRAADPTELTALPELTALLNEDDGTVARLAVHLFGHLCLADGGAIAAMATTDPAQHLRAEAAHTLARLVACSNAAPDTLDALAAALADPNATVRLAAATAIHEQGLSLLFAAAAEAALATETWPEVSAQLDAIVNAPVVPR